MISIDVETAQKQSSHIGSNDKIKVINLLKWLSKIQNNQSWGFSGIFLSSTIFHLFKLTNNRTLSSYLGLSVFHELLPLLLSGIAFVNYYFIVSDLGYIKIYLDENNRLINRNLRIMDEEQLHQRLMVASSRKIYYVRYICWLFSWPLLMFTIQIYCTNSSCLELLKTPESSLCAIILTEVLVSVLLIASFTCNTIKCLAALVSLAVQMGLVVSLTRSLVIGKAIQSLAMAVMPIFLMSWVAYLVAWSFGEGFVVISDLTKETIWGVSDTIQFAVIPSLLVCFI
ncbi:hypothetical protein DASC09_055740 [Saccharomycopsis crataegensis]|uniref:Uncharacterized protein n=1 Tax=Saccharomycopsis crataegensis TaxID=43959 RepID=A0AAV5QUG8_9ASCO|nr:hypothetical protein DASC09_055740 [Saccharomycopsis crataegensis]